MTIRFHLSCDVASGCWHLEAHDIREHRWFVIAEAQWQVQLCRLRTFGICEQERVRLEALESAGRHSAWLKAVEIDEESLVGAGFILQPTTAAQPRQ